MKNENKLLFTSELAYELGRSPQYIYQMRQQGFKKIMNTQGNRASIAQALKWICDNKFKCKGKIKATTIRAKNL